jgi:C_GCAxxG_C_C family probable redox protein
MDRADKAYELLATGSTNCAQGVISSFCEELGLEKGLALKIAQGFGGGMHHTGGACGAVTGAYMILGLAQEISPDKPREKLNATYALMAEFDRRFRQLHGALDCTGLLGYDLSIPEKAAEAREKKVFGTVCAGLVRDAVIILEDLLHPV